MLWMVPVAVNGRRRSRNVLRLVPGMLLLVFVLAGLLLMHGVRASPRPAGASGVPLMTSSDLARSPDAAPGRPAAGHSGDCGGHRHPSGHPAGQMCLALLVLGLLLLVAAPLVRRRLGRTPARRSNPPAHACPGRSPPVLSIFPLSVLPEIEKLTGRLRSWGEPTPSAGGGTHLSDGMRSDQDMRKLDSLSGRAFALANTIVTAQSAEIATMRELLG